MILRRLGNKQAIAAEIQKHFPEHRFYVEPFFGAGGMFFNKPKVEYNLLNDLDDNVFNLFQVLLNSKQDFKDLIYKMPINSTLLKYWKKNEETEPIKKALRFIFLSNYTYLGKGDTVKFGLGENSQKLVYDKIDVTYDLFYGTLFTNFDFRKLFKSFQIRADVSKDKVLIYCDPPYLGTNDNYSNSFSEQDSIDLFDCLQATGCKFAMSEFDNEFILNQAKERCLNVIVIGERKNLKNRRTEILITNYEKQKSLFD